VTELPTTSQPTPQTATVEAVEAAIPEPLSAWERVKLARHAGRPHTLDYIHELFTGFVELHGDRAFGDDMALIGGLGTFRGRSVLVLGHQKGANTRDNLNRNFGMPRPEGYRKARRLMVHAEKFALPIVTFIDTPAADPGISSEERGQSTAIAESLLAMAGLRVPIVTAVIGEGGSGGALADAGECGLRGGVTGSVRGDPLEGRRESFHGRRDDASNGRRPGRIRHHR
jgi:acetyl-CoA carboxylase carboxyl transferase subunit alpha